MPTIESITPLPSIVVYLKYKTCINTVFEIALTLTRPFCWGRLSCGPATRATSGGDDPGAVALKCLRSPLRGSPHQAVAHAQPVSSPGHAHPRRSLSSRSPRRPPLSVLDQVRWYWCSRLGENHSLQGGQWQMEQFVVRRLVVLRGHPVPDWLARDSCPLQKFSTRCHTNYTLVRVVARH